jgi:branched-chain amino acid aminotransferase group I
MAEIIYLNGRLLPRPLARLSPFDHGFLYGYGLFETMRAYRGDIFRLDRHLSRLYRSAEALGLTHSVIASEAKQSLEAACRETLRANKLKEARVRLTVSAGEGDIIPDPDSCSAPTVLITARSFTPPSPQEYERGFKAMLSSLRRDSQSPLSRLKSTSYLANILARGEAKAAGGDEGIVLNEKGCLAEGSVSNIFLVSKGVLVTPSLESGILPGITREAVLEIARSLNIDAAEREVGLAELTQAEEAFVTSSLLEIMPLTWFDGKAIGAGKPGGLTRKLMAAYRKLVDESLSRHSA